VALNVPYLSLLILIPFLAVVVLLVMPSRYANAVRMVAVVTGALCFALSVVVFAGYNFTQGGYQFQEQYRWLDKLGITIYLGVDGIAAPMVLLTGVVILAGAFVSWKVNYRNKDFFILLMALVSGVYGVFVSRDAFFLFFFYELAVIPMYLLIAVWGASSVFPTFRRPKEYGAMKLVIYLTAGSVLVWIGILATYVEAGSVTLSMDYLEATRYSIQFQRIFFPIFAVGFGVLAGLWPFHTWSPDGHVAAPTAVSMLHAGVLMKLGAFGIIRLGLGLFPEGAQFWAPALVALATMNVIYGAISAMGQRDLKYVIGYSSVSHMGLVIIGFSTLNAVAINGAVFQMFAHGVMTALFFAVVGVIYDQAHTRDVDIFGGIARRANFAAAAFIIGGLSSLGLPGLAGFIAEFLIFVGTFQVYPIIAIVGIVAAAITAVYILRLVAKVFFGPLNPRWAELHDANRSETFAIALLIFVIVFAGMAPDFLIRVISSGVVPLMTKLAGV
jgi:NADH-quinone oxidoreductase subunit M